MKKLFILSITILLCAVVSVHAWNVMTVGGQTVASGGDWDNTNYTFMWNAEAADFSATNGTTNYSAGDDTGTLEGGGAITTAASYTGTNGLDVDTSEDKIVFSPTGIVNVDADGTIAGWIRITDWEDGAAIFTIFEDANNYAYLRMDGTDELVAQWRVAGSNELRVTTTDANVPTGTWAFVEWRFDEDSNTMSIEVNGTEPSGGSGSAAMTAFTPTELIFGEWSGYTTDFHLDDIKIADNDTEDIYLVRAETDYEN